VDVGERRGHFSRTPAGARLDRYPVYGDRLIALIPKFPAGKYHALEFEALDAFDRRSMFNAMT
jgi:hypothetical protein